MRHRWAAMTLLAGLAACGSSNDPAGEVDAAPPGSPDAAELAPDAPIQPQPDAEPPIDYPCAPEAVAGHQEIDCPDSVHMDVEASAACLAGGCGLILDQHGYTMDGDLQDAH